MHEPMRIQALNLEGTEVLNRFRASEYQAERELKNCLRDLVDLSLVRKFQDLDPEQRDLNRRTAQSLLKPHLEALSLDSWASKQPFAVLGAWLSQNLLEEMVRVYSDFLERDENNRLHRNIVEAMSLDGEEGLLLGLNLRNQLERLKLTDEAAHGCFLCIHYLGCELKETGELLGLSVQQVRTRVQRALTFLRGALS